ncbi:MAG: SDR family NAD(P)-dependent oxidoreductase [Halobacteriaceae archaeon]
MVGTTRYDFGGESAIVTGSTKGIGRGIAETLVEHGANVAVNSRTPDAVERTVEELGDDADGQVIGVPADVGDPAGVEKLVGDAIDAFGEIDLLVNNAAMWPREASMIEADLDDWDQTMAVNVRSQFYASKLVAEHMVANEIEGNVVNITSQTGDRRTGQRGLYGLSNTAVNGLTWRMAADYAEEGIRVNAVSTDVTRTYQLRHEAEMMADADDEDRTPDEILNDWGAKRPLGRLGEPEDLANAVCWLASDKAAYVVGTILRVSGGGNLM